MSTGALGAEDHRLAEDRDGRLDEQFPGEFAHDVVVGVRLVRLDRGELRVVGRVGALVAEVAVQLEDLAEAADAQPLQEQFGRDPQEQLGVVGVDVGGERAGIGAAVDGLQHRGLDLDEAAGLEAVAKCPHRLAAVVQHPERLGVHHQVEVALPDPRLGVGEAVPLVRQGMQALRGHRPPGRRYRQLTVPGGDHLTADADVVADVDQPPPVAENNFSAPVGGEHHLQVVAAVAQVGERQSAVVPQPQHPAGGRDLYAGPPVRWKARVFRAEAGQALGPRYLDRVGLQPGGGQSLELAAADLLLLRQPAFRQDGAEQVGLLLTDRGGELRVVGARGDRVPLGRVRMGVEAGPRTRRREEPLGGARRQQDLQQRATPGVTDQPWRPARQVLLVRQIEALQLPEAGRGGQQRIGEAQERAGADPLGVAEDFPEHGEVERDAVHAEVAAGVHEGADHQLHQAVRRLRIAPHQVERDPAHSPGYERQQAADYALGVPRHHHHAAGVGPVAEPSQGHREASLGPGAAPPLG